MARLNQQYTPKEAKVKIAKFCAYQERCHQEVSQKLKDLGIFGTPMDTVISHLSKII